MLLKQWPNSHGSLSASCSCSANVRLRRRGDVEHSHLADASPGGTRLSPYERASIGCKKLTQTRQSMSVLSSQRAASPIPARNPSACQTSLSVV